MDNQTLKDLSIKISKYFLEFLETDFKRQQAPEHNRGVWAKEVEAATRKYASRASGDVFVITGPVYSPSIAESPSIGTGRVRVPKYLFKLVYDEQKNRAWAYWQENSDLTKGSAPISYDELVKRTGVKFLPGVVAVGK